MKKLVAWLMVIVFFSFSIMPSKVFAEQQKKDALINEFSEREREHSNYICSSMNTCSIEIYDELLESDLNGLANKLAKAAGIVDPNVKIRIFSLPMAIALSLPNEEILISSEMLNKLENRDQLAFLLAHEITHLYSHDMDELIQKRVNLEIAIMSVAMVAVVGVGVFAALAAPAASSAATAVGSAAPSVGSQLGVELAKNAATNAIFHSANWMKDEIYTVAEKGYSEESELFADENAFRLVASDESINADSAVETLIILKEDIKQRYQGQTNEGDLNLGNDGQRDQQTLIPAAEGQPVERSIKSSTDKKIQEAFSKKMDFMNERIEKLRLLSQKSQ